MAAAFQDSRPIAGRHIFGPRELEAANANLVGGAINGGTAQAHQQLVFRPTSGHLGRPETPIGGLYLASASAHPGGGVHGGPGANAARTAIAHRRARRATFGLSGIAATAAMRRFSGRGLAAAAGGNLIRAMEPESDAESARITPYRNGPYLIRGPFTLADQDGNEIEVGRRVIALCRCGKSRTRPFCDGTHKTVGFVAESGAES